MSEALSLDGKVAVITGASRGIGLRMSHSFARAGAKIVMLARDPERLASEAKAFGPQALPIPTDVSDPDAVRAAFATAVDHFGRLDILINNAGVGPLHRVEDASDEVLRYQVGINLLGPIYCIRAAIPHLRKQGGGDIVNISSESVLRGFPMMNVYAATKAGLELLSIGLREELRADKIRVSVLRSGSAHTEIAREWDAATQAVFIETITKTGYLAWSGDGVNPEVTANMAVHLVTLPREACVNLMELRSI